MKRCLNCGSGAVGADDVCKHCGAVWTIRKATEKVLARHSEVLERLADPDKKRFVLRIDRDVFEYLEQLAGRRGSGSIEDVINEVLRNHMAEAARWET